MVKIKLALAAFFFQSLLLLALADEKHQVIFVIERHSHIGFEQTSISNITGSELQLVSNSNFLTNTLPVRLGIFKSTITKDDASAIAKIEKASRRSEFTAQQLSPHRLKVLINNIEIMPDSDAYKFTMQFFKEALMDKDWKALSGSRFSKSDLLKMKCEAETSEGRVCRSNLGIIHTSKD